MKRDRKGEYKKKGILSVQLEEYKDRLAMLAKKERLPVATYAARVLIGHIERQTPVIEELPK
jgi:hypothetical protein